MKVLGRLLVGTISIILIIPFLFVYGLWFVGDAMIDGIKAAKAGWDSGE